MARITMLLRGVSWRDLAASLAPFVLALAAAALITVHYLKPAPPTRLTITSGPPGSAFARAAERYQKILARNGVALRILPSEGSEENLRRLADPAGEADIGFVQGGLAGTADVEGLVSLGSLFYEPLFIFYRDPQALRSLAALRGRRVALGPEGSGARVLAAAILKANEVDVPAAAPWVSLSGAAAASALLEHRIDAAFVMSDSSAGDVMRSLLHAPGVRIFDAAPQVDAYLRHFRFLSRIDLGPGSFDLGGGIPPGPLTLLAPTVELVAHAQLHPALSDLLIESAREVHGRGGVLHATGEFPAPLEHEYPVSDDAQRFYKSGKTFSYRFLPFWMASLVDRLVLVLVPALIVLVPALRLMPGIYAWRIRRRIYHRYGELMALERVALRAGTENERAPLRERLEEIEKAVITLKIPAAFAEQAYVLREHIRFVRERLAPAGERAGPVAAGA